VGAIAVSNPRPQLVTDAMQYAWICLLCDGNSIIYGKSWKQQTVASSTSEAEYMALAVAFQGANFIETIIIRYTRL